MISNMRNMADVLVTSIVLKNQVTLVDIVSLRMMGQYGFLATVFDAFGKQKLSVDVVATSEVRPPEQPCYSHPFLLTPDPKSKSCRWMWWPPARPLAQLPSFLKGLAGF